MTNDLTRGYHSFRNDATETVPPFGVMEVVDVEEYRDDPLLICRKPTGNAEKLHVINSVAEIKGTMAGNVQRYGKCLVDGFLPIATNSTSGTIGPGTGFLGVSGSTWGIFGQIRTGLALCARLGGGGGGGFAVAKFTEALTPQSAFADDCIVLAVSGSFPVAVGGTLRLWNTVETFEADVGDVCICLARQFPFLTGDPEGEIIVKPCGPNTVLDGNIDLNPPAP